MSNFQLLTSWASSGSPRIDEPFFFQVGQFMHIPFMILSVSSSVYIACVRVLTKACLDKNRYSCRLYCSSFFLDKSTLSFLWEIQEYYRCKVWICFAFHSFSKVFQGLPILCIKLDRASSPFVVCLETFGSTAFVLSPIQLYMIDGTVPLMLNVLVQEYIATRQRE
jgi:hypothetical protein